MSRKIHTKSPLGPTNNDNLGDHLRASVQGIGAGRKGLADLRNIPQDHKMGLKTYPRGKTKVNKHKHGRLVERFRKQHGRYPMSHPNECQNEWIALQEAPSMRNRKGKPLTLGHAIRISRVHPVGSGHKKQHRIGPKPSGPPRRKYRGLGFMDGLVGMLFGRKKKKRYEIMGPNRGPRFM